MCIRTMVEKVDNVLLRSGILCFPFRHLWLVSFEEMTEKGYERHMTCMKCLGQKVRIEKQKEKK
jgi:hypothetical protein